MRTNPLEISKSNAKNIYSSIVELSPSPVFVCEGPEMVVTVANQATLKAWGKDKSVIGRNFREALPEMEDQPFFGLLSRVYNTGITYHTNNDRADFVIDGELRTFYFSFSYQPLKDPIGITWGVLCIATDVTELVLANQRAAESENRFRSLLLKAPVALAVLKGPEFVVDIINEKTLEIWGKREEEVMNKPLFSGLPEAAGQGLEELLEQVYNTGATYVAEEREVFLPGKTGLESKFLNFVYAPYYEAGDVVTGIMVSGMDVTEQVRGRRKIEETNDELERTQQRLELALQVGRLGAYERDLTTGKFLPSSQFKRNFGYKPTDQVSFAEIMRAFLPKDQALIAEIQQRFQDRESDFDLELQIRWPDESLHWIRVSGKSVKDNNSWIVSGITQDITAQKELQEQKDDFISIASHELKTPITTLKASLQLLERLKDDLSSPMVPTLIQRASTTMNRVNVLVNDLLNASKIMEGQIELNKSRFLLSELAKESIFHAQVFGSVDIVIQGDTKAEVVADAHRIHQVIVNLVNNAVKYAARSKVITLVIEQLSDGVKLSVVDQGVGIPTDKLPHLFKRYFRVDEKGQPYSGIGLGLYISSEIIRRHGGKIGAESEPGKGSTFWFTLPLN